jgi:hypothetical protein
MNYSEATYEEISKHVESLLEINSDNLDMEAIKNQKIFVEINNIYVQLGRKLFKETTQKDKVEHARYRHYNGKMPAEHYKKNPLNEAVLKGDIKHMMNIDDVVVEIRSMVAETERIVKFLEDAKTQIKSRGFDIKNAIAWRQLMMGA